MTKFADPVRRSESDGCSAVAGAGAQLLRRGRGRERPRRSAAGYFFVGKMFPGGFRVRLRDDRLNSPVFLKYLPGNENRIARIPKVARTI